MSLTRLSALATLMLLSGLASAEVSVQGPVEYGVFEGAKADQVLAKLSPVDFAKLGPKELRRTRAAQVAAAFWAADGGYTLVCFRSVAHYVMGLLTHSAMPGSAF